MIEGSSNLFKEESEKKREASKSNFSFSVRKKYTGSLTCSKIC